MELLCIKMWFSLPRAAEDESEPEEEDGSGEEAKEPRDSGCFESSENLESGREEPKTKDELQDETSEEQTNQEEEKHEEESEQQEENQTEQLDAVQEQLQELTVDEGSWETVGKYSNFFYPWFSGTLDRGLMPLKISLH